jgi:hypothetical protein
LLYGLLLASTVVMSVNFARPVWPLTPLFYCLAFLTSEVWSKVIAIMTKSTTSSAFSKTTTILMSLDVPTVLNMKLRTTTGELLQTLAKYSSQSMKNSF